MTYGVISIRVSINVALMPVLHNPTPLESWLSTLPWSLVLVSKYSMQRSRHLPLNHQRWWLKWVNLVTQQVTGPASLSLYQVAGLCWTKSNDFVDLGLDQFVIFGCSQALHVVYVSLVTVSLWSASYSMPIKNSNFCLPQTFHPACLPSVQQITSPPPLQQGNVSCPPTPPFLVSPLPPATLLSLV